MLTAFGPAFWRAAYAAPTRPGPSPYGPLRAADGNGVMLPEGFTSRVVAVTGQPVPGTAHPWHLFPDGGATYPTDDGGWIYVSNSEVPELAAGGAGAVRFDAHGRIVDAYPILEGTRQNCAGGPTPWGTWLSCEEIADGIVYETDPFGRDDAVALPALGAFAHEAVAVDPVRRRLYLTEDDRPCAFYRYTPRHWPELREGRLEAAIVDPAGATTWQPVPDPSATSERTALQVPGAATFDGGEGVWYDLGFVYFTTKGTDQVWVHDIARDRTWVLYDARALEAPPLAGVDNLTVASSGDLYVAEDDGNLEIDIITADTRDVAPVMRLQEAGHRGSEITGPAFGPDGSRLYFSSQRGSALRGVGNPLPEPGSGFGVTYEVTGPFRTRRVGIAARGPGPGGGPAVVASRRGRRAD
jgi:secreted PhoX family phosphatase